MSNKNAFNCYIVGDDNLTIQCAEIILAANHQLLGMISSSEKIKQWCEKNHMQFISTINEFEKNYTNTKFHYLFSIVNSKILSKNILKLPLLKAINYHNSPLPKYAGLYATSWAILHGEKHHAISWHLMNEKIDAGDILKQSSFIIDEQDTALTLNLKCYENALISFQELVKELATNTITYTAQNMSNRSYFGLQNKPPHFGFITWNETSQTIDRLIKALTLGSYENKLATPKIIIQDSIFVIKSHRILDVPSSSNPGTIVRITERFMQIATKTYDLAIYELTDLNGASYLFQSSFHLLINTRLESLGNIWMEQLTHYEPAKNPQFENFWVNEYLKSAQDEVSFLSKLIYLKSEQQSFSDFIKIEPFESKLNKLREICGNKSTQLALFTAILIYLYRLNNYKNLSIKLSNKALRKQGLKFKNLFSNSLPLTTDFKNNLTFIDAYTQIINHCERLDKYHTHYKDIFIRYPLLKNIHQNFEIGFAFINIDEQFILQNDKKLNFYISEKGIYIQNKTNYKAYSESHGYFDNMEQHILALLDDITCHSDKKICDLTILGKKEKNDLMIVWNNTDYTYPIQKTVHEYYEEQAITNPDSIAAVFQDQKISYNELNQRSNQLAHYLISQGIQQEQVVGVLLNRSLEMIISILGILKSGATYLPLDPYHPPERIKYMLEDSSTLFLIINCDTLKKKPVTFHGKIIEINEVLEHVPNDNPQVKCNSSNLAYIIYTSGTTGLPKGVLISHQSVCNHMIWMRQEYNFQKHDKFLQKTPYTFDASIWELFMPFFVGGTLIFAPQDAHLSPPLLIQSVQENQISVLQVVPSMLKELVLTPGFESCNSLKHLFCGGEALLPETILAFFEHNLTGTTLYNLYGPTEATIDALAMTCTINDTKKDVSRIGKPINNTKIYVLDDEMMPVPTGILGELYISGHGLARGYQNKPEFSAKKFLPNSFSTIKNDRLYKTGDLVKWQIDGNIEYHGRNDCQIKIRGFRIEVTEIESLLEKIPSVFQCIVQPEKNEQGFTLLSSYMVLYEHADLTASEIRAILKKKIPDYMIPNRYFVVEKLHLTPNGKLDRKNIPTPIRQLNLGYEFAQPNNDIEHKLKTIWGAALKNEDFGIHDDFFELGGDSLSAMNILVSIHNQFLIHLSIRTIFDAPTIHRLGQKISQLKSHIDLNNKSLCDNCVVALKESGTKTPLFLVHPVGGSIFWYKSIAEYIDRDRPLFGIQDPALDKNELIFECLEEMATAYVHAIKKVQPKGPYLLGGASFGSTVAIEMAKQLQEQGETVYAILSLDGWAFYPILQKSEEEFRQVMEEQNSRILKKYIENNLCHPQFFLKLQWHREKMLMNYKLTAIKSKFILFKAEILTELFNFDAQYNWWDNYTAQPIELHLIPGDHETMFYESNVNILVQKINSSLNESLFKKVHADAKRD